MNLEPAEKFGFAPLPIAPLPPEPVDPPASTFSNLLVARLVSELAVVVHPAKKEEGSLLALTKDDR